MMLYIRTER